MGLKFNFSLEKAPCLYVLKISDLPNRDFLWIRNIYMPLLSAHCMHNLTMSNLKSWNINI